MKNYSNVRKIQCLEREIAQRKKVYPNLVRNSQMAEATADEEIGVMEAILADYRQKVTPTIFEQKNSITSEEQAAAIQDILTQTIPITPEEHARKQAVVNRQDYLIQLKEGDSKQPSTTEQREEVLKLISHTTITRQEKTKMLLNLKHLSYDYAAEAIRKLNKTIEDRCNGVTEAPTSQNPTQEGREPSR